MESRFAHLRQRDTSVSMLRVKMSRRRSQSQKENRERAVNTRRQLDKLPELEVSSLDASIAVANMSTIQERQLNSRKAAQSKASFFHPSCNLNLVSSHLFKTPSAIIRLPCLFLFVCFLVIVVDLGRITHLFLHRHRSRRENETARALERA